MSLIRQTLRKFATFGQKPLNPDLFQTWKQKVLTDQSTKAVQLKSGIRYKFILPESDLYEQFMKGFGPGGQKTNKANNCVVLKHLPTGEVVKCHDAREQHVNRGIALKLLVERLDLFLNEDASKVGVRTAKLQKSKEKILYRQKLKQQDQGSPQEEKENVIDLYQHQQKKSRSQLKKEAQNELSSEESV